MIKQWGQDVPELTQGTWLSFIDRCFCHVFGWDFAPSPDIGRHEHRDTIPNKEMLFRMDLMDILSLGKEQLLIEDVDMEKAFIYDENEYEYTDKSKTVDQDHYDQIDRLIDLSLIWGSHSNPYRNVKCVPMPTDTRKDIYDKMKEYAENEGIDHEIEAYYQGVPLADIIAGNGDHDRDPVLYGWADWTVSFEIAAE